MYFIGRRGAMIKTAGANVAPAEVEKAIAKVTGLVAHVVGLPDRERGQVVAAVVALDDGSEFDEGSLREALKAELSAYKISPALRRRAQFRYPADVQWQDRYAASDKGVRSRKT